MTTVDHDHDVKCWPEFYRHFETGFKNFTVRLNDRDYQPGHTMLIREFSPCEVCAGRGVFPIHTTEVGTCQECKGSKGVYTGEHHIKKIAYVWKNLPGIKPDFVILSLV